LLFILNVFSTFFLTGLIWTIQVVHYPLFLLVGKNEFSLYHSSHSTRISWIVVPVMLIELISTFLNAFSNDFGNKLLNYLGVFFVLVVWISTFLLSVPEHNILSGGWNKDSIQRLVTTNWIRTIAWTLHSFFLIYQLNVKQSF